MKSSSPRLDSLSNSQRGSLCSRLGKIDVEAWGESLFFNNVCSLF